jgi:hypothetical protein
VKERVVEKVDGKTGNEGCQVEGVDERKEEDEDGEVEEGGGGC